jgi:uncharacterized protein (TIGR00269 family)
MEGNPKTCSLCPGSAIFLDRESGIHYCGTHLKESVEERVLARIRSAEPLHEIIGVAFSGGKDSTALLAAMVALREKIPARITALTVDEGISGYREETIRHAELVCSKLGVAHRIISFPDLFGSSLDELVQRTDRKACTVCGILRRRALEVLAEKHGIRLIVTGHNQDDHAQTALMNALSADIKKVFAGTGLSTRFARRIKPFATVSEREVTLYAILAGLFSYLPECPYAGESLRGEVRMLLNRIELVHPGSMRNAARSEEEIRERLKGKLRNTPLKECSICGWPGAGEICQVCSLIQLR